MLDDPTTGPLTIVTGASSNHFSCLRNLLLSVRTHEASARLIVYDLGLSQIETNRLQNEGTNDIRKFPFDDFPEWVRIDSSRADYGRRAGCYAWKPVILWSTACEYPGLILWLDAGNLIRRPLAAERQELSRAGLLTPLSLGAVRRWTHPATLAHFGSLDPRFLGKTARNAAIIGADTRRPAALDLLRRYRDLCLRPEVIAPAGANWSNHRFDQSILTLLACEFEAATARNLSDLCPNITTHHDLETGASARALIGL